MLIYIVVLIVLALVCWYEHQLATVTRQLDLLLDKLEELTDLANDPPFNLQLDDPALVEAFKLRLLPPLVTQADIEKWN